VIACGACGAVVPKVDLPESGVEPTAKRAGPQPRTDGRSDGPAPRLIRVRFDTGTQQIAVDGWCREGVWTTLDQRAARPFVLRESWSRLRDRKPRRLGQTKDAVFQGAFARLRPTGDGQLDFVVEISEASVGPDAEEFTWQGKTIRLPRPRQEGFRFEGRLLAGYAGEIARWGELSVAIEDSAEGEATPRRVHFLAGQKRGFVAGGRHARAEHYRVSVIRLEPVERDHDGLVQVLFRMQRSRMATGFRSDDKEGWQLFGADALQVIDE